VPRRLWRILSRVVTSVEQAILTVKDLIVRFPSRGGELRVVDGASFSIRPGEVLALIGESGSGKTMSALAILGLVPAPGSVAARALVVGGRDVTKLSADQMRDVRGRDVAMIFQDAAASLNPVRTAGHHITSVIRLREPTSRSAARARAVELLRRVGIADPESVVDSYPHELSGGMQQRVLIAMALACSPRLLVADEPTTALDATVQAQVLELLGRIHADTGMAMLLITHDFGVVNAMADRIAVMYAGQIVEHGTRHEILASARHPYAQALLAAVPGRASQLRAIGGELLIEHATGPGCRFAPRCARALGVCREVNPSVTARSETHQVWCHAVAKEDE